MTKAEVQVENYPLATPEAVATPALAFYPHLIEQNLQRMLSFVNNNPDRLCPHVKTHKTRQIAEMELKAGIRKHKCATLREAAMLAEAGAEQVLVAYPLYGPAIHRFFAIRERYPSCRFSTLVDAFEAADELSRVAEQRGSPLPVLVDVDVGMHRTGICPERAVELALTVQRLPGLEFDGFHCYDGHNKAPSVEERRKQANMVLNTALQLAEELSTHGVPTRRLVLGGTPTFPFYAAAPDPRIECSPGTCVLHDLGYGGRFPDLGFTPAAVVFSRVISHPLPDTICLDCGYKAVAADPPPEARFRLAAIPEAELIGHSEEHAVVRVPSPPPSLGTILAVLPGHICPTVAHYDTAIVIDESGQVVDRWPIAARSRDLPFPS